MAERPARTTIELSDLRVRIENYSTTPLWRESSLGAKCRSLIIESLERRDAEIKRQDAATNEFSDRARQFLTALIDGSPVDVVTLAKLSNDLGISTEALHELLKKRGKGKVTNGH